MHLYRAAHPGPAVHSSPRPGVQVSGGSSTASSGVIGFGNKLVTVEDGGELDKKKVEAELEAERLWWSEASERQVKELESQFGEEFQKTTSKLRADVAAIQDRLEIMVETEKQQRHAAVADLRRAMDTQQAALVDVVRQQAELGELQVEISNRASSMTARDSSADQETVSRVQDAHELLARLRADLDSTSTRHEKRNAALESEWEQQKLATAANDAALADLRRDFQDRHASHQSQLEAAVQDLRRDIEAVRENAQLQSQSNNEAQMLHQVIMQSAGELGRGIEEVSEAVIASERKLRQELEATRAQLEETDARQCREILQALEMSGGQIAQSLADEREKRTLEQNIFQARLDACSEQLETLEVATRTNSVALQQVREQEKPAPVSPVGATPEALAEVRTRCARLESLVGDVGVVAEAVHRAEELASTASERAAQLEGRLAEEIAAERGARASEVLELRRHAEDLAQRARQAAVEAGAGGPGGARGGITVPGAAVEQGQAAPQLHAAAAASTASASANAAAARAAEAHGAVRDLSMEVASLRASVQAADVELRRAAGFGAKAEALEQQGRTVRQRLDALEGERRRAPSPAALEVELRRLEAEVRRVAEDVPSLATRMDETEAEVRRMGREFSPLGTRLIATESELQRLLRSSAPVNAAIEALKTELQAMKARYLVTPATTAAATSAVSDSPTTDGSRANTAAFFAPASSPVRDMGRMAAPLVGPVAAKSKSRSPTRAGRDVRPQTASADVPLPALSDDLRQSIHNLVNKVNVTLSAKVGLPPTAGSGNVAAGVGAEAHVTPSFAAGGGISAAAAAAAASGTASPVLWHQTRPGVQTTGGTSLTVPAGRAGAGVGTGAVGLDTPTAQEGFMRALQAVQELRERNLSLREENAELAEELLAQESSMSPVSNTGSNLPRWSPSAQQSACATPQVGVTKTAQVAATGLGSSTPVASPSRPNMRSVAAPTILVAGASAAIPSQPAGAAGSCGGGSCASGLNAGTSTTGEFIGGGRRTFGGAGERSVPAPIVRPSVATPVMLTGTQQRASLGSGAVQSGPVLRTLAGQQPQLSSGAVKRR